jgi:hypothetical protein
MARHFTVATNGFLLDMNNGGLDLAFFLRHVVALLVDDLLDLDATSC